MTESNESLRRERARAYLRIVCDHKVGTQPRLIGTVWRDGDTGEYWLTKSTPAGQPLQPGGASLLPCRCRHPHNVDHSKLLARINPGRCEQVRVANVTKGP